MKTRIIAGACFLALSGCAHMGSGGSEAWTTLYNGSGMDAFTRVGNANWRSEGGNTLVADKGDGYLVTRNEYADFVFKAEFYAESDTNSGIFIRCSDPKTITGKLCYEVNIWDDRPVQKYGTGAIVDTAAVDPMPKAGGKWNTYEITAKGDHLVVVLNGQKTVDVHDGKHARGFIALQYSVGNKKDSGLPIKFRNVQVRAL